VVGTDSATAAILAAGLAGVAATGTPTYVALAALVTAGWLILARVIGLPFLADFLARSVLVGFLTGVGVQVACGQIAGMLGVPGGGAGTIDKALIALSQISETNVPTLIVSVSALVVIVGLRVVAKQIPSALVAVIGSIVAGYTLNLTARGVALLGPVPGGLPAIGLPRVATWTYIFDLLPITFAMFVVIPAQSAATSRAYAARYEERHDENTDLVGLSLANVAAGLSGTFVVNGSRTKTQMVDSAGGRSQLSNLACAAVVMIVLLFLTGPLAFMPTAVLSAIVFLIGVELVDIAGMRRVLAARPR
jgi:MFS superfamily sulfate permease-like transporter